MLYLERRQSERYQQAQVAYGTLIRQSSNRLSRVTR